MNKKKFTIMLIGEAGSGKSTLIANISAIDIHEMITAKTKGGANTTKVSVSYEFSDNFKEFAVINCVASDSSKTETMLKELQAMMLQKDGLNLFFEKINDTKFSKLCSEITVQLPCKKGVISAHSSYSTLVIKDGKGLGDVQSITELNQDVIVPQDVNTILYFKSSPQEPVAVFGDIINKIISKNLSTPIIMLRKESRLNITDIAFTKNILDNIKVNDIELYKAVKTVGTSAKIFRLDDLVFNLQEVSQWGGYLSDAKKYEEELEDYNRCLNEIITYSISMYEKLRDIIKIKLTTEKNTNGSFVTDVLNKLLSSDAYEAVKEMTIYPYYYPTSNNKDRDTLALSQTVDNVTSYFGAKDKFQPFKYEVSKHGNSYADAVVPSYSCSCVNYRHIFYAIVNKLSKTLPYTALFHTYMTAILEDYTTEANTGFTWQTCSKDALHFDTMIEARDLAVSALFAKNLQLNSNAANHFTYTPHAIKYSAANANATYVYRYLIQILNLKKSFKYYQVEKLTEIGREFADELLADTEERKQEE